VAGRGRLLPKTYRNLPIWYLVARAEFLGRWALPTKNLPEPTDLVLGREGRRAGCFRVSGVWHLPRRHLSPGTCRRALPGIRSVAPVAGTCRRRDQVCGTCRLAPVACRLSPISGVWHLSRGSAAGALRDVVDFLAGLQLEQAWL